MTYDDGNLTGTVISGQQQTAATDAYRSAVVDLSSVAGVTGYLAFKYRGGSSFLGDAAVDGMELTLSNGTVVDLDPDLKRTGPINNWESSKIENKTDNSFPTSPTSFGIPIRTNQTGSFGAYWSGSTTSSSTGPNYDADGSTTGYYIYWETSSPNSLYTSWVRTLSQYTF